MKRTVLVIVILALLTFGSVYGAKQFMKQNENVTFADRTEEGNRSAAEGLSITVKEHTWTSGMDWGISLTRLPDMWDCNVVYEADGLKTKTEFHRNWEEYTEIKNLKRKELIDEKVLRRDLNRNEGLWTIMSHNPEIFYVPKNDVLYFVFDTHLKDGTVIDTSVLQKGYGIYIIPIQKFKGEYGYPAEDAPVFANLDPEISVRGLKKNKDGSRLYLLYQRDGMYYIRIMNRGGNEVTPDIPLELGEVKDDTPVSTEYGDGVFTVTVKNATTDAFDCHVFSENAEGIPEKTVIIRGVEEKSVSDDAEVSIAFDGEKLACVVYDKTISVSVYSKEGLLYRGTIENSLEKMEDGGEDGYSIRHRDLKCSWTR